MAINIADFQVPQVATELLSSKVELRGPRGEEDVRVHKTWRAPSVAMVRHQSKFFVVDPALRPVLAGHWFVAELRAACSAKDGLFVWPIRAGDETVQKAADAAVSGWTRVTWSTKDKDYAIETGDEHDEPAWSEAKFEDLLESALNGRILSDAEDEIVQAIRKKKVQVKKKPKEKKEEKKAKAE
ncbi:MAG: hypothetical protein ACLP9L_19235 [Thermoguttaceae bacterium]